MVSCSRDALFVLGAQRLQKAVAFPFQYTASTLPTMAIQTTLTAEGTLTLKASTCQVRPLQYLRVPLSQL